MSAFASPIVVSSPSNAVVLERISLTPTASSQFSEKWLQDTLFANPQCLPVNEIDPHIGALIPICTEIETGAGPADILYVTPTGQIVLVEMKLWRNPEARREVVAQILDYAKELTKWNYEDLARESSIASKNGASYLSDCIKARGVDEALFVDGVNRSLKVGDFLLLIVGDGIRSGAESLVGFIERYGNLRFGLGLIEVAAYKLPNGEFLLQPRILAKTEILQRTVLVGSAGIIEVDQVSNQEDSETLQNPDAAWFQAFWAEYLDALKLDDLSQPLPVKIPRSTNLFFQMPPGGGAAWISAYIAQSSGNGGVYLTFSKTFAKLESYFDELIAQREDIERVLGSSLSWDRTGKKIYIQAPKIYFEDLNSVDDRKRVISYLASMTNSMINTLRHRLDVIARKYGD